MGYECIGNVDAKTDETSTLLGQNVGAHTHIRLRKNNTLYQ